MTHLIRRFISRFRTLSRADAETHFNSRSDDGKTKRTSKDKSRNIRHWCSYCAYAGLPLVIVGCGSLKKAALVGGATTVAAGAASALSSGVLVPAVTGGLTASVTSVIADQTVNKSTALPRGQDMTNCAPDNFWTLLGSLVEMGGWLLILIVVAPMVLGWILPGPLERKKKE